MQITGFFLLYLLAVDIGNQMDHFEVSNKSLYNFYLLPKKFENGS